MFLDKRRPPTDESKKKHECGAESERERGTAGCGRESEDSAVVRHLTFAERHLVVYLGFIPSGRVGPQGLGVYVFVLVLAVKGRGE